MSFPSPLGIVARTVNMELGIPDTSVMTMK